MKLQQYRFKLKGNIHFDYQAEILLQLTQASQILPFLLTQWSNTLEINVTK